MAGPAGGKVQVGNTSKFSVLDAKGSKVKHVFTSPAAPAASAVGDEGAQQVACYSLFPLNAVCILLERMLVLVNGSCWVQA